MQQSLQLSVQALQESGMPWSLSEFLNLIELRGQTWCFAELGSDTGFSVPHGEELYFYALLEGRAHVAGLLGESIELRSGDERMKHAALFLEKTNMKVMDIAARVGYRSQAAFIRPSWSVSE
jgi:hypothetical protein